MKSLQDYVKESLGDTKTFKSGRSIKFTRANPTTTYNALLKWLKAQGIEYNAHTARTKSNYASWYDEKQDVNYEVRSANHTKASIIHDEQGIDVSISNKIDDVNIDLAIVELGIADIKKIIGEVGKINSSDVDFDKLIDSETLATEKFPDYVISQYIDDSMTNSRKWLEREHDRYAKYAEYAKAERDKHKTLPYTASNGCVVKEDEYRKLYVEKDGIKLSKRKGKEERDFALDEYRNYLIKANKDIISYDQWVKSTTK